MQRSELGPMSDPRSVWEDLRQMILAANKLDGLEVERILRRVQSVSLSFDLDAQFMAHYVVSWCLRRIFKEADPSDKQLRLCAKGISERAAEMMRADSKKSLYLLRLAFGKIPVKAALDYKTILLVGIPLGGISLGSSVDIIDECQIGAIKFYVKNWPWFSEHAVDENL
jgi:hypothetical protein